MTSKVQNRIEQRFALWDTNGDGSLDRSDFEAEGKRITQAFGESESSPRGHAVIASYLGLWSAFAEAAGVSTDGSVTAEQVTAVGKQAFDKGAAGFAALARPTIRAIADLCDTDGDGQVSSEEFGRWLDAIGVDKSSADEAFSKIDSDGSGYLTVDELVDAIRAFHLGELDVPLLGG
jgi:Ca2+-binding EF-hand superfamily protein